MQKFSTKRKNELFQKIPNSQPTLSLQSFFNKAAKTIKQKTEISMIKLQQKLTQTPSVFVLAPTKRKVSQGQNKTVISADLSQSRSKSKLHAKEKSKSQLSQVDEQRLKNLLKKKHQLMLKLRKIDQQLQNPTIAEESNHSNLSNEYMRNSHLRPIQSRANFKQNNEGNMAQHQRTLQVLSRINNEKMRRQQRLVNDLKKKQELQIKNIEQLERNKSTLFNSRQSKLAILTNINKKETEKLLQPSVFPATNQPMAIHKQQLENEFDELQDRQIGSNEKILTEQTPPDITEIIQ